MKKSRFDAPFWAFLLLGVTVVGTLGLFGLAAAAQSASKNDEAVLSVDK